LDFVNSFNKIKNNYDNLKDKNLFYVNKINSNIGSLLIHNFKLNINSNKFRFKRCCNNSCTVCNFSSSHFCIKKNNFILPLQSNSNCESKCIVYIICCNKCKIYYIGESKRRVKDRIKEHIYNINNFNKKLDKSIANLEY